MLKRWMGVLLALALSESAMAQIQSRPPLAVAVAVVLNRYANVAIQIFPVDMNTVVFRICQIEFAGELLQDVSLVDCQNIDDHPLSRLEAHQILTGGLDLEQTRVAGTIERALEADQSLRWTWKSLFVGAGLMQATRYVPWMKAKSPAVGMVGLALALLAVGVWYVQTQWIGRIQSLESSLVLAAPNNGQVLIIQEIYPDQSSFWNHLGLSPTQLQHDAAAFTQGMIHHIQRGLATGTYRI